MTEKNDNFCCGHESLHCTQSVTHNFYNSIQFLDARDYAKKLMR